VPIAAPSANISGRVSPTTAKHVLEDFDGKIPLILDGGPSEVGLESTVLSLAGDTPTILRVGMLGEEELREIVPDVMTRSGEVRVAEAPGMKYKHYAPRHPAVLVNSPEEAIARYDQARRENIKCVIIGSRGFVSKCAPRECYNLGKTPAEQARALYSALRETDKRFSLLLIEAFPNVGQTKAIFERLSKAATITD